MLNKVKIMPNKFFMYVVALVIMLFTTNVELFGINNFEENGEIIINLEKSGGAILNPGQGWILYGLPTNHTADVLVLGTTAYHRFEWAEINPQENVYNWTPIDNAIARWAQYNKQYSFGVMSVNTHGSERTTPKWVFDKGAKYTMGNGENESWSSPNRIFYIPVWDDPIYVAACKKFTQALAERYDGNPNIAFIEIRNYGNWGEMHMWPFDQHTKDLTAAQVQSLLIQPYIDSFKKTKLTICWGPSPLNSSINHWLVDNGIGLRLDGIMGDQQSTGHSGNGDVLSMAIGKTPIVWEFLGASYSFIVENTNLPWNDDRFMNNIKTNKPNYIGMGWDSQYMLNRKPVLVREAANLMGFNFSVTTVRYDNMIIGETQEITLSIENSGVTKMLTDCVIKMVLLDRNDNLVSSFTTNWDAKSINGSTTVTFKDNIVFTNAPEGTYKLAIGLYRNENDQKPTYNLDNKGKTKDGFYFIGNIEIDYNSVVPKPVITITGQPAANTNVTAGNITGRLSVAANVTQGATLSYRWYSATSITNSGGSEISGATSATFTIPTTLTVSGSPYYYFCEVRATGGASSVRSNVATVNVSTLATTPVITITGQPAATTNVTAGSITGSLSVMANVTQGATLSYRWYRATSNTNSGGTQISGATSASFAIPTTLTVPGSPYYYFCEVRATGGASSVRSDVATVNVSALTSTPVITIIDQPTAITNVTAGSISGSLSVVANVTQGATLSYRWYKATSDSNAGGTQISGARSAIFEIPAILTAAESPYYYFCELRATNGANSVRSDVAIVNVSATATSGITITSEDIPGFFTPNGDGINDTWDIPLISELYPEAVITIYNRAKKLIAEIKGAQIPWDGRDQNGNLLESGYYFYQIEFPRGNGRRITGYVTIFR